MQKTRTTAPKPATKLSEAHLRQFAEQGYTTVPEFFSAREVAAMRAELERFQHEGMLRNVFTDGDGKTHSDKAVNLQICPLTSCSDFFRAMHFAPHVLEAVGALIGHPLAFQLDQIFLKPGNHGAGTKWHQDNAYFNQPDCTRAVGMWTALHPANRANGCMHVVPGSHASLAPHQRDPNSDHHIFAPVVPEERAVPIELPAGGVLFFDYGTLHCTTANTTAIPRAGLALHFVNAEQVDADFWKSPIVARLTGPGATGGLAEYGVKVEGTWDEQVERLLAERGSAAVSSPS